SKMNADAQAHIIDLGGPQSQLMLRFERTPNSVYRAFEQGEHAISRHPEKPALVCLQLPRDDRTYFTKGADRAVFVLCHHGAEAGDVSGKDRTQAATGGFELFFRALTHYRIPSRKCFFILARKVIRWASSGIYSA